ncbi:MAG: hypothetical protein M1835_004444 [Candelina submexicana]|nr:MAG: hypothetical protein M1835_004444 [Candelina submexicana]
MSHVQSMPDLETSRPELQCSVRKIAESLVQYRITWPNGFGDPIPAKVSKRHNLQFIAVAYHKDFGLYSISLVLENHELEHITLPEAIEEYRHVISRKWSTESKRKEKVRVTISASAFRCWCLLQAVLRIFGSQMGIANFRPNYLDLSVIVDEKTGIRYSSTMIWVRKTESIVLIPDYSTQRLEDIQYTQFISDAMDITQKITGMELKINCKQAFCVWQAMVSVEFSNREDYERKNALDTARTQTAKDFWAERAKAAGKEPNDSEFVENYTSRLIPGKKTAVLLPACAHISKKGKDFGTYDEDFVPGTLAVNRAADIKELDIIQAWQAVIKLRLQMGIIHGDGESQKNQPYTSDAKNLWVALNKTQKKRTLDRELANFSEPWYPVHTLFKKNEDGRWLRRAPINTLLKARRMFHEANAAETASGEHGTEAPAHSNSAAIVEVPESGSAQGTIIMKNFKDGDEGDRTKNTTSNKRQRFGTARASTTRPSLPNIATETTPQGPSQGTLEFAEQCIELFHKSTRNSGEKPDVEMALEIVKNATQ